MFRVEYLAWGGLATVLVLAVVLGVSRLPGTWRVLDDRRGELPVYGTVPPFSLTERNGERVVREDLAGVVWIAAFIFTRCRGVCPLLSRRLGDLQRRLDVSGSGPIRLVSFSVDPEVDTPVVLREYARRYGASPTGWLFLTGEKAVLHNLIGGGFHVAVAQGVNDGETGGDVGMIHSDRFVLVDSEFRIRGYYRGTDPAEISRLKLDVQRLLTLP